MFKRWSYGNAATRRMPKLLSYAAVGAFALGGFLLPAQDQSVQAAEQDETLRVAANFIPRGAARPDQGTGSIASYTLWPIYDTLTMVNLKGEMVPLLALEWENVDPTTWRFKLRPGVKFQNGEAFNAKAVVAELDYLLSDAGQRTTAGSTARIQARVASARAINDLTVEVKTKGPNPILPRNLAGVWIPAPKAFSDLGLETFARNPSGTGSYKVVEWKPEEVKYEAFDASWRPAKIARLNVVALPERATRVQALVSEQVDIAVSMSIDSIDQIVAAGHKVDSSARPSVLAWRLFQTSRKSPFNDVRVRQAANYAIDRDGMVKNLLRGMGASSGQCANPSTTGFNNDVKPYPHDPAKAKQLLTEAGFPNGFDAVIEVVPGSFAGDTEIYQAAAQQLTSVGIRVTLRSIPFSDWLKKWYPPSGSETLGFVGDAFSNSCHFNNMDGLDAYDQLSCKKQPSYYCDEEELKLINAAATEMDPVKRVSLLEQLQKLNHDNAALIVFNEIPDLTGLGKRVQGFTNFVQRLNYHEVTLAN